MSITISDLEEPVANGLSLQAASHGRTLEAEIRDILTRAATSIQPAPVTGNICDAVRGLWQGTGSTDEMMKELRGED